jgi:serine/threonine protein kinase
MASSASTMHGGLPNARGRAPSRGGGLPRRVGPHEIVGVLGMSAANEVLLATTRGPHGFVRPVVVKRVRDPDPHDPTAEGALVREALAYSRLNHPSVVQLYEVIEDDDRLALILEYVPGVALSRMRSLMARQGGVLDDAGAMHIMASVFAALAAAHEARDPWTGEFVPVVHRDVNPNNVLISWDGVVKLTDFGIARVTGVASDTRIGLLKGTYGYMAPEQVLGDAITPRTDVYCACLMLRELLLGRPSFTRRGRHELELMQEMAAPRLEPVERLRPGIPPVIAGALRIGLEIEPDARAITAAEMRDVLEAFAKHEGRARLAASLAGLRPTADNGPHEQSATTGQLGTLPEEAFDSMLDRERERAPTLPDAPPMHVRMTEPDIVDPPALISPAASSTPSLQVDTPQAMSHAVLLEPQGRGAPRAPSWLWLAPLAACLVGGVAATLAVARWKSGSTDTRDAAPHALAAHASATAPAASTSASHPGGMPSASAPAPPPSATVAPSPASSGDLLTPALADSHRVFVDGRVLGVSGDRIRLPCGLHHVQIGSRGRLQSVVVPCGGQVVTTAQW